MRHLHLLRPKLLILQAGLVCATAIAAQDGSVAAAAASSQVGNGARAVGSSAPGNAPPAVPSATPFRDFEDVIRRAGESLFAQAIARMGAARRTLIIDPVIDAASGAQTVSTVRMDEQLLGIASRLDPSWTVLPRNSASLAKGPMLLIGTLTPGNEPRSTNTPSDGFSVCLALVDVRSGRLVASRLDRTTVGSVNPMPLKFYRDSPTWQIDKATLSYIKSCQAHARGGEFAEREYLSRLKYATAINEAIVAYESDNLLLSNKLFKEADLTGGSDDLRALNGLYVTNWRLDQPLAAREAFGKLVRHGFDSGHLPIKLLFRPGATAWPSGDVGRQYEMWMEVLAEQATKTSACWRIVGHVSRASSSQINESLSRQRAEAVRRLIVRINPALQRRMSAAGVGSREAIVGLGTDDARDALDRRVDFRVVDCV